MTISKNSAKSCLIALAYELVNRGKVSKNEMRAKLGFDAVAQRICDLRDKGFNIATHKIKGDCIYELVKANRRFFENLQNVSVEVKSRENARA